MFLVLELEIRQQRGILPPEALLLTVPDPQEQVGSGGATLNALLVAAEHLSARAGYTVSDSLEEPLLIFLIFSFILQSHAQGLAAEQTEIISF